MPFGWRFKGSGASRYRQYRGTRRRHGRDRGRRTRGARRVPGMPCATGIVVRSGGTSGIVGSGQSAYHPRREADRRHTTGPTRPVTTEPGIRNPDPVRAPNPDHVDRALAVNERSTRIIATTMHPWHDSYVDDAVVADGVSRRHRDSERQQEQVRARQGDGAAAARSRRSTARSTTRPTTASSRARSATMAIRSTRWCSARSRCIR